MESSPAPSSLSLDDIDFIVELIKKQSPSIDELFDRLEFRFESDRVIVYDKKTTYSKIYPTRQGATFTTQRPGAYHIDEMRQIYDSIYFSDFTNTGTTP
jgi:hypothetical protein